MFKEQKEAKEKAILQFEDHQDRLIRETKNKQAAEVNARRHLSSEEMQQVIFFFFFFCLTHYFGGHFDLV